MPAEEPCHGGTQEAHSQGRPTQALAGCSRSAAFSRLETPHLSRDPTRRGGRTMTSVTVNTDSGLFYAQMPSHMAQ